MFVGDDNATSSIAKRRLRKGGTSATLFGEMWRAGNSAPFGSGQSFAAAVSPAPFFVI